MSWPARTALYNRNYKKPCSVQSEVRETSGSDALKILGYFDTGSKPLRKPRGDECSSQHACYLLRLLLLLGGYHSLLFWSTSFYLCVDTQSQLPVQVAFQ